MQHSLLSDIITSQQRYNVDKLSAVKIEQLSAAIATSQSQASNSTTTHHKITSTNNSKFSLFDSNFTITIDCAEKRTDQSLLKSSYIVYCICITRTSDREHHTIRKRFKEISQFFKEVS